MPDFFVAEIPVRDDPALLPLWEAIARLGEQHALRVYGNTDLADSADMRRRRYQLQEDARVVQLVAVAGSLDEAAGSPHGLPYATGTEQVIGCTEVDLPLRDNLDLAFASALVDPSWRRRGVGTALMVAAEDVARTHDRTKEMSWTEHRDEAADGDADAVRAPTGAGVLSSHDPAVAFAQRRGFALEQTERHSVLQLPVPGAVLSELRARADERSDGYRIVTWVGPTPPEHRDAMADLHRRMSVDIPMGALEFEEEHWDAERVARSDERQVKLDRTILTAVAQHVGSGRLVAFTVLAVERDRPEVAYQNDTLVHGDHRGHRLGLAVKLANLDLLTATCPQVQRIHTWNAGENQWMLAINVAMGFTRASTEGAWQRHY